MKDNSLVNKKNPFDKHLEFIFTLSVYYSHLELCKKKRQNRSDSERKN